MLLAPTDENTVWLVEPKQPIYQLGAKSAASATYDPNTGGYVVHGSTVAAGNYLLLSDVVEFCVRVHRRSPKIDEGEVPFGAEFLVGVSHEVRMKCGDVDLGRFTTSERYRVPVRGQRRLILVGVPPEGMMIRLKLMESRASSADASTFINADAAEFVWKNGLVSRRAD